MSLRETIDRDETRHEGGHVCQEDHIGAVARGVVGVSVGFDEQGSRSILAAARASGGANSRWPPELVPWPLGCWTEWVTSKTTE